MTGANLQNIPKSLKKYMYAPAGRIFIEFELAKAEAHIVAYLCQDVKMMEIFTSGRDIHTYNAAEIFEVSMEEVTEEQRKMGKKIVHARNYLMGARTFSDNLAVQGKDGSFFIFKFPHKFK